MQVTRSRFGTHGGLTTRKTSGDTSTYLILSLLCVQVYVSPFIIQVSQLGSELLGLLSWKRFNKLVPCAVEIVHIPLLFRHAGLQLLIKRTKQLLIERFSVDCRKYFPVYFGFALLRSVIG